MVRSKWKNVYGSLCKIYQSIGFLWPYLGKYRSEKPRVLAYTTWKVSKYGVISGPYFPVFGLNTEIYEVNLRIQSEYRNIRTRNNSVFGHFSRSDILPNDLLKYFNLSIFENIFMGKLRSTFCTGNNKEFIFSGFSVS